MGYIVIEVPENVDLKIKAKSLDEAVEILKEKIEEQKKILLALYFLKKYGGKLYIETNNNNKKRY